MVAELHLRYTAEAGESLLIDLAEEVPRKILLTTSVQCNPAAHP